MRVRKRLLQCALFCVLIGSVWVFVLLSHVREVDAFSLDKVIYDNREGMNSSCPLDVLSQKFSYIGHGSQAIAFEGEDKKTVLKCFLKKKISGEKVYKIPSLCDWIPSWRREKVIRKQQKKEKKISSLVQSYSSAFSHLKEETGLIAIHLSATEGQYPVCSVRDFRGKEFLLDLDRASFVVQSKATIVRDVYNSLQTEEEKTSFFQAMETLLERRAQKGFKDLGQGRVFEFNYGFLEDKAILFDVGRLVYSEEVAMDPLPEIQKMQSRLYARFNHPR